MMESPTREPGIGCPRCGGTTWRTRETRKVPGRVLRIRTCKTCYLRIRTREVIEAVPPTEPPATVAVGVE